MYCDLHTHSHFSDGSMSPSQIIALAKQHNLIVALTDHNTTTGLPEFIAQAERQNVTAVPGIELSTEYQGMELHLLGLFVKPEHYEELEWLTERFRAKKEESNWELVRRLQVAGYEIDYQTIKASSPNGIINRAHIAASLFQKGYVLSVSDAFERLLKPGQGFYCPPERLHFLNAIQVLVRLDILPIWAHPLKDMNENQLRAVLPEAMQAGLVGMEIWHSSYNKERERIAAQIAREHRLLAGGGSDFHGMNKPGIKLDCCHIPAYVYYNLLRRHNK